MMREWIGSLAMVVIAAGGAHAQEPEPRLEVLGGTFECSVLQTAAGDVLQLACTETESPLAEDHDFEVYRVTRQRYSDAISIWLRANTAMEQMRLAVTFRHSGNDPYTNQETTWAMDIAAGETWTEAVYPDFTWTHVDIAPMPGYGWECKGCGTFVGTDIPISSLMNPASIQPQDAARFLQEMQSVVMPRR